MQTESARLVELCRQGDEQAAEALFRRYVDQLVNMAQSRLSAKLARRVDAEDIVQSVFRSFFVSAQQGRFQFNHTGDLWHLLAAITLNKIRRKVELNTARKRAYDREQSVDDRQTGQRPEALSAEPSPDEVLMLVEEVQLLTEDLDDRQRKIVDLRLSGYKIEEIANEVGLSERTVRRVMGKVKTRLQERSQTYS